MKYPFSELVLDKNGHVYHLGFGPEALADDVILVGDQDRVSLVSNYFDTIEHVSQHREFVCHTGTYKRKRITVLSTGIGTDNIDIVVNELDALANIDLKNRLDKSTTKSLRLLRIGTCGLLQSNLPVHSYIVSTYAIGLDNIAHFYPFTFNKKDQELAEKFHSFSGLPNQVIPYAQEASVDFYKQFISEKTHQGITITSSGFYAPQGRSLRMGLRVNDINEKIQDFRFNDQVITNFEMESSAIFVLGKNMGHQVATICLGVANRPNMEFSKGYTNEMNELILYVLDRL
jgi:uridine phosphorylase